MGHNYMKLIIMIATVFPLVTVQVLYAQVTPSREWINFYGKVMLDGTPLSAGSLVQAFDQDGTLCGQYQVTKPGEYGFLACYIDDVTTSADEGVNIHGDRVSFEIRGVSAGSFVLTRADSGSRHQVDLNAITPPVQVPEPLTIALLATGLTGVAAYVSKRKKVPNGS